MSRESLHEVVKHTIKEYYHFFGDDEELFKVLSSYVKRRQNNKMENKDIAEEISHLFNLALQGKEYTSPTPGGL